MAANKEDVSGFNLAMSRTLEIRLPRTEDRDWTVFWIKTIAIVLTAGVASIALSMAQGLSGAWMVVNFLVATGTPWATFALGWATDARHPEARTRRADPGEYRRRADEAAKVKAKEGDE